MYLTTYINYLQKLVRMTHSFFKILTIYKPHNFKPETQSVQTDKSDC